MHSNPLVCHFFLFHISSQTYWARTWLLWSTTVNTVTFCPTEQSSHSEDGCVSHGSFSCHRKRWEQHQASHAGNRLSCTLSRFKQRQQCTGEKQPGKREVYTNSCLYKPMLCIVCQAVLLSCQHENAHTNYFQVSAVGVFEPAAVAVEDEYKNVFSYRKFIVSEVHTGIPDKYL